MPQQQIGLVTVLVPSYEAGLAAYRDTMGFELLEDTPLGAGKRWVVVAPASATGMRLLLARADGPDQIAQIGHQAGGRVAFFLHTTDFAADYDRFRGNGIRFLEAPRYESYGTVAQFADPLGNKWDLIQPKA